MRVPAIGEELPSTDLLLKRKSYTLVADVDFYDDEEKTQPTDLVGDGVTGKIEVVDPTDPTGATIIEWSGVVNGNRIIWELTSSQTDVTWNYAKGRMVLFQSAERRVINFLNVRVQG
jgi:hypothetical protein